MRKQRFKRWIVWTPCCRYLRAAPSATVLNIAAAAHHTSADFVDFLGEVVAQCRPRQEIHIILDNLSAHKTQAVREFLETHPHVRLHFTPTYSSWLNQVELWF